MKRDQMGPLLLSGLIIGPVLGSGIILLPPIIYRLTGDYAIAAWLLMMGFSYLFAHLFGKLSIVYPGESGLAVAVERAFGTPFYRSDPSAFPDSIPEVSPPSRFVPA